MKSMITKANQDSDAKDNDQVISQTHHHDKNEDKVKAIFESSSNHGISRYSNHDIRAMLTFLGDICDFYLESGFQYRLCTKSVRFFLVKWFPSKIRCEVFRRLRDCLHLLNLDDDHEHVSHILKNYLTGGIPAIDHSLRDSPDFLDEVSSSLSRILNRNQADQIMDDNVFFVSFCVATLARTVAISIRMGGVGLNVAKHRLSTRLDGNVLMHNVILETAQLLLMSSGTLQDLVHAVVVVIHSKNKYKWFMGRVDDLTWDKAITKLQALHSNNALA